ncbi:MAG: hypothetical protein AB7F59_08190 [Bdellovibrionales bacterium]
MFNKIAFTCAFIMSVAAHAAPVQVTAPALALPLAATQTIMMTLTAPTDFDGTAIELSIDRRTLDTVDLEKEVMIQIPTTPIVIRAGQTIQVPLALTTAAGSPSFDNGFFLVNAKTVGKMEASQAQVALKVEAIYEVRLDANHAWSTPRQAALRTHPNGVLFRVYNYDQSSEHLVHGAGAIPHASTPLARATPERHGGVYEVRIPGNRPSFVGQYYCHNHETSQVGHNITFNSK